MHTLLHLPFTFIKDFVKLVFTVKYDLLKCITGQNIHKKSYRPRSHAIPVGVATSVMIRLCCQLWTVGTCRVAASLGRPLSGGRRVAADRRLRRLDSHCILSVSMSVHRD